MLVQTVTPSFIFGTQIKIFLMKCQQFVWYPKPVKNKYCLAHKKYSHGFIKLRLNHWCHMDCFNDSYLSGPWTCLIASLLSMGVSESSQISSYKYLNLCSEDERRSYRFGTTRGWVINDRTLFFCELSLWKSLILISVSDYSMTQIP